MLEIGKANEITFKVAINGTSATPQVRLVIETPDAELGFNCNQGDDYWFSQVFIPEDTKAGDYTMRVEVVINNRLFTPVKKTVTIANSIKITTENVTLPTPTQTPDQTSKWEDEGGALPAVKELPKPISPEKISVTPDPHAFIGSLLKETAEKVKAAPVKAMTNKKKPASMSSGMPKVTGKKAEPIRIKIAEIAAESNRRFDKVLAESASYRSPIKPVTPIPIKKQTPVALHKGEIVYE